MLNPVRPKKTCKMRTRVFLKRPVPHLPLEQWTYACTNQSKTNGILMVIIDLHLSSILTCLPMRFLLFFFFPNKTKFPFSLSNGAAKTSCFKLAQSGILMLFFTSCQWIFFFFLVGMSMEIWILKYALFSPTYSLESRSSCLLMNESLQWYKLAPLQRLEKKNLLGSY